EEQGVEIGAVSGSSAGAMIALLIAAGWRSDQMEAFLHSLKKRQIFRLGRGPGIFSLEGVGTRLREALGPLEYGDLQIPCYSCVTDLQSARSRYLNSGDPIANVLASSSLTPLFHPRQIDQNWYIDGGFSDNLPVRPLLAHALPVLSINVNPLEAGVPDSFRSLLIRSILIMLNNNIRPSIGLAQAHLEVQGVATMHPFEFSKVDMALESGYLEMKKHWSSFEKKLQK
uniref:patatin-like phospholipase family protein n=1 Tax=Nitratifractor sp. TaxID=2268144 RepID=UPI0025E4BF42